MKKSTRWLLALCIFAVAGVFLLQFFWIRNYYYVNQATFEKETNLVFEDAINKEFNVRCDTIEHNLVKLLLDTNEFLLSNTYNSKMHVMMLHINNKRNPADKFYFHTDSIKNEIPEHDNGADKIALAKKLAHQIRVTDLQSHYAFYRTQKLGEFISAQERKYDFDTTRLRPIFKQMLAERDIHIPFVFYVRSNDSTYNAVHLNAELLKKYPVVTRAFVTYKQDKNQHYVRAMFTNPFSYVVTKMGLLFLGSVLLIGVIAFSLFYLLKSLLTEKKLSAIKNDFISNITHELKTPIATVSAAVESLADFDVLDDPAKTKRYLTHSKNELQRLSALVETILNSTLYESQQFEIKPEKFNVDEVLYAIIDQYKLDAGKKVTINYQQNNRAAEITADKQLFRQVIGNIMDNAIKYSGEEVVISMDCSKQNQFLVISIKDNGMGILKEHIPYLFEKFFRVPSGNQHKVKGHGLGLNYVKSILERHKGWCKVESEYGKGTTIITGWPI